jgi:hypothetical protein
MVFVNSGPFAKSGVMSLKTIPGLGKLGTSRIAPCMLAMSLLIIGSVHRLYFEI